MNGKIYKNREKKILSFFMFKKNKFWYIINI